MTDLPFLDLGDETRVHGDGKIFGVPDVSKLLNETELPSYLPFPFGDGNETKIYVSSFRISTLTFCICMCSRFHMMDSLVLVLHILIPPHYHSL